MNRWERLEEIKKELELDWSDISYVVNQVDVKWLINRVEELEKEKDEWKDTAQSYYMTNQELREQNKRYKQALEFYADENNYREYDLKGIVPPRSIAYKPILHDYGSIARQALESDEN